MRDRGAEQMRWGRVAGGNQMKQEPQEQSKMFGLLTDRVLWQKKKKGPKYTSLLKETLCSVINKLKKANMQRSPVNILLYYSVEARGSFYSRIDCDLDMAIAMKIGGNF